MEDIYWDSPQATYGSAGCNIWRSVRPSRCRSGARAAG